MRRVTASAEPLIIIPYLEPAIAKMIISAAEHTERKRHTPKSIRASVIVVGFTQYSYSILKCQTFFGSGCR